VWQVGFVPVARALAIQNLPASMAQNTATKTRLFSTRPAPAIAYFTGIGTFAAWHYGKAKSLPQCWPMLLTTALRAYATLVVIPHLNCLLPFVWLDWRCGRARAGSSVPQFMMRDLPATSKWHAEECLAEAKAQGLGRVRPGNVYLLSDAY